MQKLMEMVVPVLIFLATLITGYIARKIVFARLAKWSAKTETEVDDVIVAATKGPFIIWFVMLGLYFATSVSGLPYGVVMFAHKLLGVLGILSVTFVLANISGNLIRVYSGKVEAALPVTSLTQNISRIVIFALGFLMILNSLGISITPILATLGVGGLAVALALQDTLSNFFAGFHIIAARQVKVGDYIKLESGDEGYVTDINWRITKIRTAPNNMVLVPNDKITKSIIINYHLPEKEMAVPINVNLNYANDLDKAEKIALEVARDVIKNTPGSVMGFEPAVRYTAFGDFGVNFVVALRAKEFTDQHLIKHEFIKKLHLRFAQEGIKFSNPVKIIGDSL